LHVLDRFWKNTQIPYFMKIRPVEFKLFHADRRTDGTKIIGALRNFVNAPKKVLSETKHDTSKTY